MPLIITQGYGKPGTGLQSELVPTFGYGGSGPVICSDVFQTDSVELVAPNHLRVRFTDVPLAVSNSNPSDCLYLAAYGLTGPTTLSFIQSSTYSEDNEVIDLYLANDITPGTWTLAISSGLKGASGKFLVGPYLYEFTVVNVNQEALGQGGENDLCEDVIRKHLNPSLKGPGWDAFIAGVAAGDCQNRTNARLAFDQKYVSSAKGFYLDRKGGDQGVRRPDIGIGDELYRELITAFRTNQLTQEGFLETLEIFYGTEAVRAYTETLTAQPYPISDGESIKFLIDEKTEIEVTFRRADFARIRRATAAELAFSITRQLRAKGSQAFAAEYKDPDTGEIRVRVYSPSRGIVSGMKVTGGSGQPKLQFDLSIFNPAPIGAYPEWLVTIPPEYPVNNKRARFKEIGTYFDLNKVRVGDYVTISSSEFSPGNRGVFSIVNVVVTPSEQYFEVDNLNGVAEHVDQCCFPCFMFFRPIKKTIYDNIRYVVVAQHDGEMDVIIPATTQAVQRSLGSAAYLHAGDSFTATTATRDANGTLTVDAITAIDGGLAVGDQIIIDGFTPTYSPPPVYSHGGQSDSSQRSFSFNTHNFNAAYHKAVEVVLPGNDKSLGLIYPGIQLDIGGSVASYSTDVKSYKLTGTSLSTEGNQQFAYSYGTAGAAIVPTAQKVDYDLYQSLTKTYMFGGVSTIWNNYANNYVSNIATLFTTTAGGVTTASTLANLATAVARSQSQLMGTKIIVSGGYTKHNASSKVQQAYNVGANTWAAFTNLVVPRVDHVLMGVGTVTDAFMAVGGRNLAPQETLNPAPDLLAYSFEDATPVTNFTSTASVALAIDLGTSIRENGKIGYGVSPQATTDLNAIAGAEQNTIISALKNEWTIGTWMTSSTGSVFFSGGSGLGQGDNVGAEFGILNASGSASKKFFWRWQWGSNVSAYGLLDVPPSVMMPFAHLSDQPVYYHMAVSKKLFIKEWDATGLTNSNPVGAGIDVSFATADIAPFDMNLTITNGTWATEVDKGSTIYLGTGYTAADQGWYYVYERTSSTIVKIKKLRDSVIGSITLPTHDSNTAAIPVWYNTPAYTATPIQGLAFSNQQKSLNGLAGSTTVTLTVVSGAKVTFTRATGTWPDTTSSNFQEGDLLFINTGSKFSFQNQGWYRVDSATTSTISATKVRDLFYQDLTLPVTQVITNAVQYLSSNLYPGANGTTFDDITAYQSTYDVSAYVNGIKLQTWARMINSQFGSTGTTVLGSTKKSFAVGQNSSTNYRGCLDEVWMFGRAITDAEVKTIVKGQLGTIRNVTKYVTQETVPAILDVACATTAPLPANTKLGQGPNKSISFLRGGLTKNQYGTITGRISFDDYVPAIGAYILVKDEGQDRSSPDNGIYKVITDEFEEATPGVFTQKLELARALLTLPSEFIQYTNVVVRGGTQQSNTQWILSSASGSAVDVDPIVFANFLDYSGDVLNSAEAWKPDGSFLGFAGSMEFARYGFAKVDANGVTYAIGGMGYHATIGPQVSRPLASCEFFKRTGSNIGDWMPLPAMNYARAWPSAKYLPDTNEIVVYGGFGAAAKTVEFLSLDSLTWRIENLSLSNTDLSTSFPSSLVLSVADSTGVKKTTSVAIGGAQVQSPDINPSGGYAVMTSAQEWLHLAGESQFWAGGINGVMAEVLTVNSTTLPTIFTIKTPNYPYWTVNSGTITVTKLKAKNDIKTLGPYMFSAGDGVGISGTTALIANRVSKGSKRNSIQLLATYDNQMPLSKFPNSKGFLSLNFGREATNQPIPYLFIGSQPSIIVHMDVRAATRPDMMLPAYTTAGSGASHTLTANANGALTLDGVALDATNRVFVKDALLAKDNGIYIVTSAGSTVAPYVLTRASDFSVAAAGGIEINAYIAVLDGDNNHHRGWRLSTSGAITVETTPLNFTELTDTNELFLDYSYIFKANGERGDVVTLLVSPSAYVPKNIENVGAFYITDSPAGRKAAEDFINAIKATGFKVNLTVVYPGDKGLGNEGYPSSNNYKISDKVVLWAGSPMEEELQEARTKNE